jgi:hypothetical protein
MLGQFPGPCSIPFAALVPYPPVFLSHPSY